MAQLNKEKYKFNNGSKIFVNKHLTLLPLTNQLTRQLKRNGAIHATGTRDGIIHLRHLKQSKPLIIFHEDKIFEIFPDFALDDDEDLFLDVSQEPKLLCSIQLLIQIIEIVTRLTESFLD